MTGTSEHSTWKGMSTRCNNKDVKYLKAYGRIQRGEICPDRIFFKGRLTKDVK